jgi:very-short-patch-repair endonuclease
VGDRGVAEAAGAQRGLVALAQVRAVGIGRSAMRHRIARGAWHVVLPGVLAIGHPVLRPWGAETAALLYVGDGAVLSHGSAAALWGLADSPSFVAITLIDRHVKLQPGLRVHRVCALDIRDVRVRHGFPVTAPARTLIDCAGQGPVDRLLNEARALRLVTDADIHEAMDRCPGRKGTGPLRALLAAEQDTGFTRSEAERKLRWLVKEAGIERPVFNTKVMGLEVDTYWPRRRVMVEVDGYGAHGHRQAFERDRAKDAKLTAAGYVVIRVTWRQLTQQPMAIAAQIAAALAARG